MNGFSGTALVAVAALALAGCGGTTSPAPKAAHAPTVTVTVTGPAPVATAEVTASTSPPMTPGPAAYLAWARSAPFIAKKFLASERTEANLLGVGKTLCKGEPWSFDDAVWLLTSGGERAPSQVEAEEMVKQAVTNLCPQNQSLVP
jgi:hypothetical protein